MPACPFTAEQKKAVISRAADLGNASVPHSIAQADIAAVEKAYHESFISAYGSIMRLSAGLAFLGAAMAVIFINGGARKVLPSVRMKT